MPPAATPPAAPAPRRDQPRPDPKIVRGVQTDETVQFFSNLLDL